ncbi:MAG: hypothetical protein U9N39_01195 [Campylobacterota bacterium]|nr:hypothetical protein [Campylobacterota bacterium]
MKPLKILIIALLPVSIVYASQSYVKVTKTDNPDNFSTINSVLKQYSLKMKILKIHNSDGTLTNIIYTGPFSTYERGAYYQRKLKNHFPNPQVVTSSKEDKRDGFYFGLGFGYGDAYSSYDNDTQSIELKEPQNSGVSYTGELGYVFSNGMFSTIGYSTIKSSDLHFENVYASLGYRVYDRGDFVPYASVLLGAGSLTWSSNPLEGVATDVTNKSTSPVIGSKIGLIYDGFESVSLAASYQLLILDHTANISADETTSTTYNHSALNIFLLEFQHKF